MLYVQLRMTNVIESHHKTVKRCTQCTQDEADNCVLHLHAAHAARQRFRSVVICSQDKDVFIVSLAFCVKTEAKLFQNCGSRTSLVVKTRVLRPRPRPRPQKQSRKNAHTYRAQKI